MSTRLVRMRAVLVTAALLLAASGCGGSDDDDPKTSDEEPTTSAYVTEVNRLCEQLIEKVVPITGDSAPSPSRQRYLDNQAKLRGVYAEFDTAVGQVPVETERDREAENAFTAYLTGLAAIDADMTAKAVAQDDRAWQATFDETMQGFRDSPESQGIVRAGISCPAR